ncbi:MAG: triose-phosphate isomerase [Bacteroidota bacterium]|nr:triose-phosphate isomerase [Bacteroidota bacterium]
MSYPNDLTIEVCVDNFEMALAAERLGASRIELCSSLVEGGITPPLSLMEMVCETLTIPVHVMIRPRAGDFLYGDAEFALMKKDIQHALMAGASGVVFGVLCSDGTIDRERCQELVSLASPMDVTFHRAFDMTVEPFFALEEIIAIGCQSLLTSGQLQTAEDGLELIRELVKRAGDRIEIVAGGGVNPGNVVLLHEAGVKAFHFTSRKKVDGAMKYKNEVLQSMGNISRYDEYGVYVFDETKLTGIYKALSEA